MVTDPIRAKDDHLVNIVTGTKVRITQVHVNTNGELIRYIAWNEDRGVPVTILADEKWAWVYDKA